MIKMNLLIEIELFMKEVNNQQHLVLMIMIMGWERNC